MTWSPITSKIQVKTTLDFAKSLATARAMKIPRDCFHLRSQFFNRLGVCFHLRSQFFNRWKQSWLKSHNFHTMEDFFFQACPLVILQVKSFPIKNWICCCSDFSLYFCLDLTCFHMYFFIYDFAKQSVKSHKEVSFHSSCSQYVLLFLLWFC